MKLVIIAFANDYQRNTRPSERTANQWIVQVLRIPQNKEPWEICRLVTEQAKMFDACLYELGRPRVVWVGETDVGAQVNLTCSGVSISKFYKKNYVEMVSRGYWEAKITASTLEPKGAGLAVCQIRHKFGKFIWGLPALDSHTYHNFSERETKYAQKWAEVLKAL